MKDYQKKQIAQLNALIVLLLGDLTVGDRQKIMTICTIDVHSRDVVAKLIVAKVETSNAFQWQSQLRYFSVLLLFGHLSYGIYLIFCVKATKRYPTYNNTSCDQHHLIYRLNILIMPLVGLDRIIGQ